MSDRWVYFLNDGACVILLLLFSDRGDVCIQMMFEC